MASIKDIAERAGTSIATVSLALHGGSERPNRVRPEKVALIRQIAEELNYTPNAAARMMLAKKSGQIGVVIRNAPDKPLHNPPNYEIIVGLSDKLADEGYLPVIIPLKIAGGQLDDLRVFKERLLDGIVFTDSVPEEISEKILSTHKASIFVESSWNKFNCIRRDELGSGAEAVDKLRESGARRIVYFGLTETEKTHFSVPIRRTGIEKRCSERKLDYIELLVRREAADVKRPPLGSRPLAFHEEFLNRIREDAKPLINIVKTDEACGIVTYNTLLAHAAYTVLSEEGLIAGRDYALASCDTCFEMELNWPELACCEFNRYETGRTAADMILRLITENKVQKSISVKSSWHQGSTVFSK